MSAPQYLFDSEEIISKNRVKRSDVDLIKSWNSTQNHVPELSEQQVVVFLLSCCNDCEATKATILAFYSLQHGTPELFADRSLERADLQKQLQTVRIGVLPERTPQNHAVLAIKIHDVKYYNLDMAPCIKLGIMTLNSMVYDNPPDGFIVIIDMKGLGIMHLTRIVIRLLKPFFRYVQEALPVRLEEILVLNTVYFINKVMGIIKPFMNPKLMEKLHFHTSDKDFETFLGEFVDTQCIPKDYGGTAPSMEELHTLCIEKLKDMKGFFAADELQVNGVKP